MLKRIFYLIAAQIIEKGKKCAFPPDKKCVPTDDDEKCVQCVLDKLQNILDAGGYLSVMVKK